MRLVLTILFALCGVGFVSLSLRLLAVQEATGSAVAMGPAVLAFLAAKASWNKEWWYTALLFVLLHAAAALCAVFLPTDALR